MARRGKSRRAAEDLPGSQPVQEYLSAAICEHEVSALATGEKQDSFSGVSLMKDHRGCKKLPVGGSRQDGVELSLRQPREKARPELGGKARYVLGGCEFAVAFHGYLSQELKTAVTDWYSSVKGE
jgi:hypothetical protein